MIPKKLIPQQIVYALEYESQTQLCVSYSLAAVRMARYRINCDTFKWFIP